MRFNAFFLLLLVLNSCYQEPLKDLSIFKYNETSGIHSLDPAFAKDQATVWATNQLFNGLVQLDENLNIMKLNQELPKNPSKKLITNKKHMINPEFLNYHKTQYLIVN